MTFSLVAAFVTAALWFATLFLAGQWRLTASQDLSGGSLGDAGDNHFSAIDVRCSRARTVDGDEPTPTFITVNLLFSSVFAAFGGFVTLIAGRARMQHAGALAALMFAMGILSFVQNVKMKTSGGRIYRGSLVILGLTGPLLGGYIQTLCVGT